MTWVSRLRLKDDWYPTLMNIGSISDKQINDTVEHTNDIGLSITAVSKHHSLYSCKKRLMSMNEINKINSKKSVTSIEFQH